MSIVAALAIITLAALIHASFQVSVSTLTLLNSYAAGKSKSNAKQFRLSTGFIAGVAVMTALLLATTALVFIHSFKNPAPESVWAVICGLLVGVGAAVWLFYYRYKSSGTTLWIPRAFARHLNSRSKETVRSVEAFSLGMTSVIGELLFIAAPMAVSALVIIHLPGAWQLLGVAVYAVVSLITLISIWVLIGGGYPIGKIQKWREKNKRFLQFASGGALIVLGFFVYVFTVVSNATSGIF